MWRFQSIVLQPELSFCGFVAPGKRPVLLQDTPDTYVFPESLRVAHPCAQSRSTFGRAYLKHYAYADFVRI